METIHTNTNGSDSMTMRLATGLGWFSIGLGIAEVAAPGALANLIGIRNKAKTRKILRSYGLREIAAGIGILTQTRPAGWLWGRVAGDVMDLATLGSAMNGRGTNKGRAIAATAAVVGVTALDVYCSSQMTSSNGVRANGSRVARSIIVDSTAEKAYQFWHDFQNLPSFMTYLDSVRKTGDRHSHWTAIGPAGARVEWDAELTADEPNRRIAWRSRPDSSFENSGSVQFECAPGNRGTLVRVEMNFTPGAGLSASGISKVLGMDIGRRIHHDLRNFKQMIEIGEITKSDASIHPGMHAAQPDPAYQA